MLEIRKAKADDFDLIENFYKITISRLKDSPNNPEWVLGVYPSQEYLKQAIANDQLLMGILDGECVSSLIVNNSCNPDYSKGCWKISAEPDECTIIHTFGVLPDTQGKGIGRAMMEEVKQLAKQNNQKAIRLDVLGRNSNVSKFYEKIGFEYIDTVKMFYEDTGLTDFLLYEYVL